MKALVLEVGGRHLLGVGAAGLALLSALPTDERARVIAQVVPRLPAPQEGAAKQLGCDCAVAQAYGAAVVHETLSLGVSAVGLAFRDTLGQPAGALSVAALSHHMNAQRVRQIADLPQNGCAEVQRRLHREHLDGWKSGAA